MKDKIAIAALFIVGFILVILIWLTNEPVAPMAYIDKRFDACMTDARHFTHDECVLITSE